MSNFSTVDMLCFTGIKFFFRDVDRNELATYSGNTLTEWYVWGNDIVGKIKGSTKYYFFKDHLGSVRAVVDNNFNLVSAVDGACPRVLLAGDMWGDKMQGRIYNGDSTKFGFTGKEEDDENLYDYFGARHYDSRIANWTSVDPLMDKHFDFGPYVYVLRNPLRFVDPDGKQIDILITKFIEKALPIIANRIGSKTGKEMAGGGEEAKGFGQHEMDVDNDGILDDQDEIDDRDDNQRILDDLSLQRMNEIEIYDRLKPIEKRNRRSMEELSKVLQKQIEEENEQEKLIRNNDKIWKTPLEELIKELIY